MAHRLLFAIGVFILVGLGCLLLGALVATLGIPVLAALGAFLVQWAWIIAFALAVLAFVSGRTLSSLR